MNALFAALAVVLVGIAALMLLAGLAITVIDWRRPKPAGGFQTKPTGALKEGADLANALAKLPPGPQLLVTGIIVIVLAVGESGLSGLVTALMGH